MARVSGQATSIINDNCSTSLMTLIKGSSAIPRALRAYLFSRSSPSTPSASTTYFSFFPTPRASFFNVPPASLTFQWRNIVRCYQALAINFYIEYKNWYILVKERKKKKSRKNRKDRFLDRRHFIINFKSFRYFGLSIVSKKDRSKGKTKGRKELY